MVDAATQTEPGDFENGDFENGDQIDHLTPNDVNDNSSKDAEEIHQRKYHLDFLDYAILRLKE